jgi:uncharacterized small protein (DUF1192 family)
MARTTSAKKTEEKKEPVIEQNAPAQDKTYSASEVEAMLAAMQAQIEELKAQNAAQPVAVLSEAGVQKREMIKFRWQAPVSDDNVLEIGPNGRWATITGKERTFSVPKDELGNVLTAQVRNLLDMRWLIVLDGLDEEEMEAIGCRYAPGEILDRKAFSRLVELGGEIVSIYKSLCDGNREIVAKVMYEDWQAHGGRHISRDTVVALKKIDPERAAFSEILREMNEREAK